MKESGSNRMVIGMTGASGALYGIRALSLLGEMGFETHLVLSDAGRRVIELETGHTPREVEAMATHSYEADDVAAPIASGSFPTDGMVIVPCTMKTLSGVANSYASNLIERAADVTLKERRKLVLVVRETPLHKGHLRLMTLAADIGACILPPIPAFYHRPASIDDIVDQTVGRIFDHFAIEHDLFERWGELAGSRLQELK